MRRQTSTILVVLLLATAAEAGGLDEARKGIDEANSKIEEYTRKGDAKGMASLYTDDARVLPPGSDTIRGRQKIQEFWKDGFDQGISDVELETVDVGGLAEDLVYEVGTYSTTLQPKGKDETTEEGKYLVVWKKAGGGWNLHVDIWNVSAAPGN